MMPLSGRNPIAGGKRRQEPFSDDGGKRPRGSTEKTVPDTFFPVLRFASRDDLIRLSGHEDAGWPGSCSLCHGPREQFPQDPPSALCQAPPTPPLVGRPRRPNPTAPAGDFLRSGKRPAGSDPIHNRVHNALPFNPWVSSAGNRLRVQRRLLFLDVQTPDQTDSDIVQR